MMHAAVAIVALALTALLTSRGKKAAPGGAPAPGGGPTVPTDTPGGGGGGGQGSPPPNNSPPPSPSGGSGWIPPKVGTMYAPNKFCPETTAMPFAGRGVIESWAASEGITESSPPKRHTNALAALETGLVDAPRWVRVPVREGLEVEAMADVVSVRGVRLCASMITAQAFADAWGAMLLTPGISDAIWAAAKQKIKPQTIGWFDPPGKWRNPGGSVPWLLYEADRVQSTLQQGPVQSAGDDAPLLIATLGKDYVLTADAALKKNAEKCCIYGWHQLDGAAIQSAGSGQSFIHELTYYDYSHAIRLVRSQCWLNGKQDSLARIYREQPRLVSYKGRESGPIPARHPGVPMYSGGGVRA